LIGVERLHDQVQNVMISRNSATSQQPLVSVLTPVYNGERHLAECIESVLGQTYENWEYIIVNNCSRDRTFEIVTNYASRDSRIRICNNSEFVGAVKNHNIALAQISPASKYCKIIQADDLLFPTCLAEMVSVAEAHPAVGIVTAYQLWDRWIRCDGLPYPSAVIPGREMCRSYFLNKKAMFGNMSSFLLRSELVRSHMPLFNEKFMFADTEVYFVILQDHDYGFVHQVLSFHRIREDALSSSGRRDNEWTIADLYFTKKYGQTYLTPEEYDRCLKRSFDQYYRCQGHELFRLREKSFWKYHRTMMEELGFSFSSLLLLKGAMLRVADVLLEPIKAGGRQVNFIWNSHARLRPKVEDKS
jgi:glycosyltransferase involved in cell wall biosynthesis